MYNNNDPSMPGGVLGNGSMLVTVNQNGTLHRLFWPNIDWGQHLGIFKEGIREAGDNTHWLGDSGWACSQNYSKDSNILLTEASLPGRGIHLVTKDMVMPTSDILVRSFNITNQWDITREFTFLAYCSFNINDSPLFDGMYAVPESSMLVQFRRDVFLGVALPKEFYLKGFHCGRRGTPSDPLDAASRGEFWGGIDNIKNGAGVMAWDIGPIHPHQSKIVPLYIGAAHGESVLMDNMARAMSLNISDNLDNTAGYWKSWLDKAKPMADESSLYNRSLLCMKILTDKNTGASVAAPEFDAHYTASGGYGYCWPRDGMFVALALDEAGMHQEATNFYRFASRVQNPDGSWQQRYFMNGNWAPTWGKQIDQAGAVLWGYSHHYSITEDKSFLEEIWPSTLLGTGYLINNLSPENNLPNASMDIWEDEYSQSTYASAAVYGGLAGAAALARAKGDMALANTWQGSADNLRQAILDYHWSPQHNSFTRSINRRISQCDYDNAINNGIPAREQSVPGAYCIQYSMARDPRMDASLLGLCFPYRVLSPRDSMMVSTAQRIIQTLSNSVVGGLHRYEGDCYAGGNPWPLLTLWLSVYLSMSEETQQALSLISWAENKASATGLLPEQVHRENGSPAWVLPLNWSHAMYVLACLSEKNKFSSFFNMDIK